MHGLSARLCSVPCRYTAGNMPFPLSAHRLHTRPPLPLYAGVEPTHTRICSILSCDVFARVVWIKLWEETDLIFCFTHLPHSLATQYSLRLGRVCGRSSKEEPLPLFVLFVLFGQAKSTWCFMYFCMTKSTKSHLRRSLLDISLSVPALLKREQYAPSCANISSEPSDLG